MRFAYADPPYLGCGRLYAAHHPEAEEGMRPVHKSIPLLSFYVICGSNFYKSTDDNRRVTCKRCLRIIKSRRALTGKREG